VTLSAEVVIAGGGVIGAGVAHHLAARGVKDVLILDRADRPGEGSTGRATGGFRAQYATAINVRLSLLAREKLRRFRDEIGVDPGYVEAGYLWLASSAEELAVLREAQRIQRAEGLHEACEVGLDDIARLNPAVDREGLIGGVFCPTDGFLRPLRLLEGYLASAERLGARVLWGAAVRGFERDGGGRITSVRTDRDIVSAGAVVDAAGPWAAEVASFAGIDLPVAPLRRQVAVTAPCDLLPASMPMTLFASDAFHLRERDGRVLLLWPTPGVPDRPFDTRVDPAWIAAVAGKAGRRIPLLRGAVIDAAASWAGLYEVSPDKHAVVGALPSCPNLYFVNGSSGHGVMHAPALGQILAEIITAGRASSLDVRALRPSRFAEGDLNPISELL
jgi:sarcosine oxidase, subunit beta